SPSNRPWNLYFVISNLQLVRDRAGSRSKNHVQKLQITNPSQLLERKALVGVDAHSAGDLHRFLGNLAGGQGGVIHQRLRRGSRIRAAAADGGDAGVRLN